MYTARLSKMRVNADIPVTYILDTDVESIALNSYLGKKITIRSEKKITCSACGSLTRTSFAQGYCFRCMNTVPETEACVLHPELCQAHEGIARNMAYATTHCLTQQYVYLAVTNDIKVGVTRLSQKPIRWIDQGASHAIIIAEVPNRHTAGIMEVALKARYSDKTNWQKMLCLTTPGVFDLPAQKELALSYLPDALAQFASDDETVYNFEYPMLSIPEKVKSLNLDKTPEFEGILTGIKGQYLILDNMQVFNVRSHTGYHVQITFAG